MGLRGDAVVYAMRITDKKTLSEYDQYCSEHLRKKIPDWSANDYRRKVGDCIYDYASGITPVLRKSVHDEGNIETDLGGQFSLLSNDFYYFGKAAVFLPDALKPIVHKRGHKSNANAPYVELFIDWIRRHEYAHGKVFSDPAMKEILIADQSACSSCARRDRNSAEEDEDEFVKQLSC